jgi:uncharacterized membrane protein
MAAVTMSTGLQDFLSDGMRRSTERGDEDRNVGGGERLVSGLAGSILLMQGLERRGLAGLLISGVGSALIHRGVTGRCKAYAALGTSTAKVQRPGITVANGIHVASSILVSRPPSGLYDEWSRLENLPRMMTHLKSVEMLDDKRSRWVASAPSITGGQIEWEAETVKDIPGRQLSWASLPGSQMANAGRIQFSEAPGGRGTIVSVRLDYRPPAGRLGHCIAKLFGEDVENQIYNDLRSFKRRVEVGELPTTEGQTHGNCGGLGFGRRN